MKPTKYEVEEYVAHRNMLIRIPVELHKTLKSRAYKEETSMSKIVRQALADYLDE